MRSTIMKLSFLQVELDPNTEHEITADKLKGLDTVVKFKNGKTETFNNLTEVHWDYSTIGNRRVAFETDIHGTGFTYEIDKIESVEIDTAVMVEECV